MNDRIIAFLFDTTLMFSLLFAGVWLIKKAFGSKLSAFMHYVLWGVVIIKLVLPFSLPIGMSPWALFSQADVGNAPAASGYEPYETLSASGVVSNLSEAVKGISSGSDKDGAGVQTGNSNSTPVNEAMVNTGVSIDWAAAGAVLWISGAAAMAAWLAFSSIRIRRRIARNSTDELHENVAEALKVCREALGIKRDMRAVMQDAMPVPAIMGAFRPRLLLPKEVEALNDEELKHVMLHELTHLKRGDLAATLLLNTLNTVYWFNPLVWLAFRLIRKDMETVCDTAVLKTLGKSGRQMYIGTVVQFAGRRNKNKLLAALSINDAKASMQARIKGMFMAGRTKLKVRITVFALACVMLFTCFTTACQPTPEKPYVQSKTGDSVQQAIESNSPGNSAEIHRYSAPATWRGEVRDDAKKIEINVDAKVTVPTDTWGIYELIPKKAEKAYIDKVLKTIIGDAQIYGEDTYISRTELQSELVRLRADLENVKNMSTDPRKEDANKDPGKGEGPTSTYGPDKPSQSDVERDIAYLEERIANVEKALASAPDTETAKRVPIDIGILFEENPEVPETNTSALKYGMSSVNVSTGGMVEIHALADTGKYEPANVNIYKEPDGNIGVLIWDAGTGNTGGFSIREPLDGEVFKANISEDEAARIARQAAADMGLDYLDIAAVHKMSIYDKKRMEGDRMPECYAFTFTRSLDGVPATYAYRSGAMTDEEGEQSELEYAVSWNPVEALIGVDERGIVYAEISASPSAVNKMAEGIELKDFDEIMEIFNRQAAIEGCFSPGGSPEMVVGRSVRVDEVRLGYMPTTWKDHPNGIIFVPVWDFFGSETTTYDANYPNKDNSDLYSLLDENYQLTEDLGNQAILTINALDGTIMRRVGE